MATVLPNLAGWPGTLLLLALSIFNEVLPHTALSIPLARPQQVRLGLLMPPMTSLLLALFYFAHIQPFPWSPMVRP